MRFLAQYVQTLDAPPPFVTALGLTATQLEVEQWVFTEKRKPPPDGRGPGGDQDKEAGERSELEKIVQDLYEIRGAGMEERWATVVKRPTARLILLGAPGQGKTFSTKATVLKIAAAALADIHSFRCQPDAVPVAVWVKAAVWAKSGATNLIDALLDAMRAEENQTPVTACDARAENWLLWGRWKS